MPYIKPRARMVIEEHMEPLIGLMAEYGEARSAGELNYILTRTIQTWLGETPDYTLFNAVVGVLECAKQELYRRVIAEYEDGKIALNGDVY